MSILSKTEKPASSLDGSASAMVDLAKKSKSTSLRNATAWQGGENRRVVSNFMRKDIYGPRPMVANRLASSQ
jgi:hypothetical protein